MVVSGRIRANGLCTFAGVFVGLFTQFEQTGAVGRFFILYPSNRAIIDCNFVFHNWGKLSNVETNFDSATEFANANVLKAIKRPVKKPVRQFDVANKTEKPGNAYKRVDL
jgi:hypothetical protein